MAVTTTPRMILTAAYSKSMKNKPGTIATESTELLQLVIRATRGLYAFAARINPTFFAESADVAFSAPGWARPQTAESVFRIEALGSTVPATAAGTEIVVVPFDDRTAESAMPGVYQIGQIYRSAGNAADPTGGSLRFFYSKRPTDPATLDATLDALWVEQFNELLSLEVAIYLATKDERAGELNALIGDRDRWAQMFVAFLEHETANERRRWGHIRRFNTNTLVPVGSLLAGGSKAV